MGSVPVVSLRVVAVSARQPPRRISSSSFFGTATKDMARLAAQTAKQVSPKRPRLRTVTLTRLARFSARLAAIFSDLTQLASTRAPPNAGVV